VFSAAHIQFDDDLIVLFASRPHSPQTYETSTSPGVNAVGVALTYRIPDLQMGQLGAAKTKS
jgi:hypothetical protein